MSKLVLVLLLAVAVLNGEPFKLQYPTGVSVEEVVTLKSHEQWGGDKEERDLLATFDVTLMSQANVSFRKRKFLVYPREYLEKNKALLNSWVSKTLIDQPVTFQYDTQEMYIYNLKPEKQAEKAKLDRVFENILLPIFLIAGQELEKGLVHQFELESDEFPEDTFVTYTVTQIEDPWVHVEMTLEDLDNSVFGTVKAAFHKENAFIHTIDANLKVDTTLLFWPFTWSFDLHMESKAKEQTVGLPD